MGRKWNLRNEKSYTVCGDGTILINSARALYSRVMAQDVVALLQHHGLADAIHSAASLRRHNDAAAWGRSQRRGQEDGCTISAPLSRRKNAWSGGGVGHSRITRARTADDPISFRSLWRVTFRVTDAAVLSAIGCHTLAQRGLSLIRCFQPISWRIAR